VAGVSEVFKAGIVTYSNRSKTELLGVPADVIEEWGAVSEQVALAMVRGALGLGFSDYAIAITGIAGPTGGTPQKPVGTVFISWGERDDLHVRRLLIRHPRNRFQRLATLAALDIFRRYTRDLPTDVFYYFDELSLMSGQP
jgi:nicotinamide-nucleotide amidase